MSRAFDLRSVRADVLGYCDGLRERSAGYGAYRAGPHGDLDLYSSCDVAIIRTVMGEELEESLAEEERQEWCGHINSFALKAKGGETDGTYGNTFGHSVLHANGTVIGALGVLGGKQPGPVSLYASFDRPEKVTGWLESLDWKSAWRTSHAFWGGVHCFSFSALAGPAWLEAVFSWLDANLDPDTGWWARGVPHADRHQGLGGAAHLLPLYEHHDRPFPRPERLIDSVLALQLAEGHWLEPGGYRNYPRGIHYFDMDALYALELMRRYVPDYRRGDIEVAVGRYSRLLKSYYADSRSELFGFHPHVVLAAVGTFGLLQRLAPDEYNDSSKWSDIFSDRRLYRTREVECLNAEPFAQRPL